MSKFFEQIKKAEVIREIATWTIDGERDDISRYFYHFEDVGRVEDGKVYAVVGYKGQGKTAIAKWLDDVNNPHRKGRCARLSLRDFNFPLIYDLADKRQSWQSQYVTIWQYVIISAVCQLIQLDDGYDPQMREYFRKQFPTESKADKFDMHEMIERGGSFSFLQNGFTWGPLGGNSSARKVARYTKVINKFKSQILHFRNNKPFYVIFDELDEDYNNLISLPEKRDMYFHTLIGLLKAIDLFRRGSEGSERHLYPVMMLRRDIFDLLTFGDKGKLIDKVHDINWSADRIKKLIAYRIWRAAAADANGGAPPTFAEAWPAIFDIADFQQRNLSLQRVFNYISARTYLRPRDFVAYLREAANVAISRGSRTGITAQDILDAEPVYSSYLRQEIEDACGGIDADFVSIITAVSEMGRRIYTATELAQVIVGSAKPDVVSRIGMPQIIDTLFYFNIIGMHRESYAGAFHYMKVGSRLRADRDLVVHRGLWRNFNLGSSDLSVFSANSSDRGMDRPRPTHRSRH